MLFAFIATDQRFKLVFDTQFCGKTVRAVQTIGVLSLCFQQGLYEVN